MLPQEVSEILTEKTDVDLEKQTSLFLKQARKKEWAQQKLVQYIQTLKDRKEGLKLSTVRSYFKAYFALKEWLDYRKQNDEKITGESWLMRDIWAFKYNLGAGNPQRLSTFGVKKLVNRGLDIRSMVGDVTSGKQFYKRRAEQAGMGPVNVETLMDHSTGMSDHYYRPTEHDLLKDYLKAVDNLTIDNTRHMVIKEVS